MALNQNASSQVASRQSGSLQFKAITYTYEGAKTPAINDVRLAVESGELVVLVGPSGCGKSTLLRMVAGLIDPSQGELLINDRNVVGQSPQQRKVGWVPQSYGLFDHLTVSENISFGLKMHRVGRVKQKQQVQSLLALCKIQSLASRSVRELSGGQRQRVAIARALAVEPNVLLLDEPLAALDPQLRSALRAELVSLIRQSGATTLFVTHDQAEALAIADRIAVFQDGCLEQYGRPEHLWNRPANDFVAEFLSNAIVIQSRRISKDSVEITPGLTAKIEPADVSSDVVRIALRASDIVIDTAAPCVRAVVLASEYTGGQYLIQSQVPDGPRLSFFSAHDMGQGTTVPIRVRSDAPVAVVGP